MKQTLPTYAQLSMLYNIHFILNSKFYLAWFRQTMGLIGANTYVIAADSSFSKYHRGMKGAVSLVDEQ